MHKAHFELVLAPELDLISITPRRLAVNSRNHGDTKTYATLGPIIYGDEEDAEERKLCVIFAWFTARKKHLLKFAQLYLNHNFDVLLAKNTPSQVRDPVGTAKVS